MSKSLEVFSVHPEAIQYDIDKAKQVINDKLEKAGLKKEHKAKQHYHISVDTLLLDC